nr:MAG TPA: tail collar fiber protein [Caudoviricetes sp.]
MADEKFFSILTKAGQAKIANSIILNKKVDLVTMKAGDGAGAYYDPTETQTDLRNVVWEGAISEVSIDTDNPNWINIKAVIPTTDGGFTIREYGCYDSENNLIGVCKCAETYKPVISDGSTKELILNMVLAVVNTDAIELKIDPTIILATKNDVEELRTEVFTYLKSVRKFLRPTGTANAILLKEVVDSDLFDGYSHTFLAKYNNDSTLSTTINGKNFYKPNTTKSPTIKAGKAYTFWYETAGDCFFIKASAEGNVTADHVLANDIFSNDDDTGLVGTMPNNGKINKTAKAGDTITIPLGYTDGGTIQVETLASQTVGTATPDKILSPYTAIVNGNKITGTMGTTKPSYADQYHSPTVSMGAYSGDGINRIYFSVPNKTYFDGINWVDYPAPNLTADNIVSGKEIFGVVGNAGIGELAGTLRMYNPSAFVLDRGSTGVQYNSILNTNVNVYLDSYGDMVYKFPYEIKGFSYAGVSTSTSGGKVGSKHGTGTLILGTTKFYSYVQSGSKVDRSVSSSITLGVQDVVNANANGWEVHVQVRGKDDDINDWQILY